MGGGGAKKEDIGECLPQLKRSPTVADREIDGN